ncbi:hypothetical protein TNCV_4919721 [Trichonephila clavipes]|nr:hypothetical protein TNCV_4919721 [Trichonephila clavipes]
MREKIKNGAESKLDKNKPSYTFNEAEPLIQVSRHQEGLEEKSQILQSNTIHQYNKNMCGVDQQETGSEKNTQVRSGAKKGTVANLYQSYQYGYRKYVYSVFILTNCEKQSINDIRRYIAVA